MVRKIKFRAWDEEQKEMIEVNSSWQSEFELMQYTGIDDKNGIEIYEGDILEVKYGYVGEVIRYKTGEYLCSVYGSIICDYANVIGNVYENKELLEETDERN